MSWQTKVYENCTAVIPLDDLESHSEDTEEEDGELIPICKCQPKIIWDKGHPIIVHSSFDGRECIEEFNRIVNKEV